MIWRDRCFFSIFLGLVLIALFGSIKPQPLDPLVSSREVKNWFWAHKVHSKEKYDMIIMGDSRLYRGISPVAMEKVFGKDSRILNFGFSSGGLNNKMYKEAEGRFANDGRNQAIVLAVTPHSLTPESAKNEHFHKEFSRPKEDVLQRLSYNSLWAFFTPVSPDLLRKKVLGKEKEPQIYYHQDFYADGWVASYTAPMDQGRALKSYTDTFTNYQVDDSLIDDLCQQTITWKKNNIEVYAFRPPVSDAMLILEDKLSGFNQRDFVSRFQSCGGVWIEISSSGYETYDGSHLHRDSAVRFSTELAKRIDKLN